jgi:hypothetical protein
MGARAQILNLRHLTTAIIEAVVFGARLIHSRTQKKSTASGRSRASLRGADFGLDYGLEAFESDSPVAGSFDALSTIGSTTSMHEKTSCNLTSASRISATGIVRNYGACNISNGECRWIGLLAFEKAFEARPAIYAHVSSHLTAKRIQLGAAIRDKMGLHSMLFRGYAASMLQDARWL